MPPLSSLYPTSHHACLSFFFFNDTATTEIYTLSLHDALPICAIDLTDQEEKTVVDYLAKNFSNTTPKPDPNGRDRKSTRLNSSHLVISYAVFCLKKKNTRSNSHACARLCLVT